ncbi:YigZ family protein [Mucilaginibacter sp. RS28]|uniref:YigZ family protein n=1 Tax=Mucilaginibacter straminoryzae TaxID=2932774 RepID=A0A9X1X6P8_9SPHI|nr:YigZ family protein [Mucilaginibacter straminoryzae]MCJ8211135.1 YigZ family protein [Mucilaginibacter straminoryzae]
MLFDDTYRTIKDASEGDFRDRGSRFLAFAYAVTQEAQIKDHVAKLRAVHPSARHYCWAARFTTDQGAHRFNDDGEPAGTAGRPILNTILSKNLNNVLVVVVRYFGGTLLGVPGLINAYKSAAEDALSRAEVVEKTMDDVYEVKFEYLQMNNVMKIVKDYNFLVLEQNFDLTCVLKIGIRKMQVDRAVQDLTRISNVVLTYLYSL